jgi:GTP-binding protein Era
VNIQKKYCGHIAIIGKPNSGKSTLINSIIQDNISVVSRKKHTTQKNIIGILTENNCQYIYLDTPGVIFFKRHDHISENIKHILKQIKHSILIIFVLDQIFWTEQDETIYKNIKKKIFRLLY